MVEELTIGECEALNIIIEKLYAFVEDERHSVDEYRVLSDKLIELGKSSDASVIRKMSDDEYEHLEHVRAMASRLEVELDICFKG